MSFSGEDRTLLEDSLARFLAGACTLDGRWELLRSDAAFSRANWAQLAELGVIALPLGDAHGGLAGSLADVMAVTEALGAYLALEPYLPCVIVAGRLLENTGSREQRQRWLPQVAAGEALLALAHVERGDRADGQVRRTTLARSRGELHLHGTKFLVPVAREADAFLVTARDEGGKLAVCLVPANAPGLTIRAYRTVDDQRVGEVDFADVALPSDALLPGADEHSLEQVLTFARAALAADSLGAMRALWRQTIEYCSSRKQFGQPIARFQVIRHRLVDGHTRLMQAEAMLALAACDGAREWMANVAAAKAFIDEIAVRLGHDAIQMHGAMGMTDELAVSHYHKRLLSNAMLYGDRRSQLDAFIARTPLADPHAPSGGLPFPQLLGSAEEAFRQEVRTFLGEALTPELRTVARRLTCTFPERGAAIDWQRRLHARGWLAPLWPKELGGTGWSAVERFVFEYECAVGGAPERMPTGFRYVGPVIAKFGSAWQKEYFLPRLLSSEHYWAQGFSEPGAGSDLAAIKTAAVLQDGHYVVNGSKTWTTHAHCADWIFCLVRTAKTAKPQEGISFLLIDLKSPGIRVEPIRLLAVDAEVNEVFFDDVRVPAENLVGEPGRGWQYAKYLLELERGGSVMSGRVRHEFNAVKELLAAWTPDLGGDPGLAREVAELEVRVRALEIFEFRFARSMTKATDPGVGGSMVKLVSSELLEDVTEFGVQVAGLAGLEFTTSRPILDPATSRYPGSDLELVAMPRYLNTRAFAIFAGTSEIQHEIIARDALGLR